jgi:hypothetical protein
MEAFFKRALLAIVVVGVLVPGVRAVVPQAAGQTSDTAEIGAQARADGLRFRADVAPADQQWILASIANARPEAQALIAEVDGIVEVTTLPDEATLGSVRTLTRGSEMRFTMNLDITDLNGEEVVNRDTVVMHELGHVVDHALVPAELNARLDEGIPHVGGCVHADTGSCTAPEERFADTFAKWALRGAVSVAAGGYSVAAPASLEEWGAPLGTLSLEIAARR